MPVWQRSLADRPRAVRLLSMTTFTTSEVPDMTCKTVIVTGAISGIGRSVARDLAAAGARVVLAARSIEKGKEAAAALLIKE